MPLASASVGFGIVLAEEELLAAEGKLLALLVFPFASVVVVADLFVASSGEFEEAVGDSLLKEQAE